MTWNQKLDFILEQLYRHNDTEECQSIMNILKQKRVNLDNPRDWWFLRKTLLDENLVAEYDYPGYVDLVFLKQKGKDFCEVSSFTKRGVSLLDNSLLYKKEIHMNPLVKLAVQRLYDESEFETEQQAISLREMIPQEVSSFYSEEDKIDFLKAYQERMEKKIQRHRREGCENPAKCIFESSDAIAKAVVAQELKRIEDWKKRSERQDIGTFNINIHGNSGIINLGKVEGDINNYTQQLQQSGHKEVSDAIHKIVQAIKDSYEASEQDKLEYLETLKILSEEAVKPKQERLPKSTLKTILDFGLGTLNAFSSMSTITGVNLPVLSHYFLQ